MTVPGAQIVVDGPDALREALVARIVDRHHRLHVPMRPEVFNALSTVPRHLFTPGVALAEAYADDTVVTKSDGRGISLSAVSAPTVQALMLGQLGVEPGHRVLEIGSGGYNAALISELVGASGEVTTIDIDRDVTDRARACLTTAGYDDVRVLQADGEVGASHYGPFDRIIVTVGAWDIPPAWIEQLTDKGRLVAPLRTRGLTRSWALERNGDHLVSRSHVMCGFVPMQGIGQHRGHSVPLHDDDVSLWFDERQHVDTLPLTSVLRQPWSEAWSGVTVRKGEPFSDLDLWLATMLPGFALLTARQEAIDSGIVSPGWRFGTPAMVDGPTLGYRAKLRPIDSDDATSEFGAYAHGPDAGRVADQIAQQIARWDSLGRPKPHLSAYPARTPDTDLPDGFVLDKRHTRVVISWPSRS